MSISMVSVFTRLLLLVIIFFSLPAYANRVTEYLGYKGTQEWKEALKVIRKEINEPAIDSGSYLSDINMLGLDALGNVARYHGYSKKMDAEAKVFFRKARKTAADDKVRVARALHGLFNYYSKSARNGLAIPFITQELELWKDDGNQYQVFVSYDALATAYGDMGEVELRNYYRKKAFAISDEYFELGEQPNDANEWLNYVTIIRKDIDNNARVMPSAKLEKAWKLIEEVTDQYITPKSISYYNIAKMFAMNGQDARAQEIMSQARDVYEEEKDSIPTIQAAIETDLSCAQAQVDLEGGRYQEATNGFLECRENWQSIGKDMGGATWGLLGYAFERGGNFDDALDAYEKSIKDVEDTRSSFSVSQRATFFRNDVFRRPYWGAIRIHSQRAKQSKNASDFSTAIRATERIRARQFGELLNKDVQKEISNTGLKSLRKSLRPKSLVLNYVFSENSLVILAFDKNEFRVSIVPYNPVTMRNTVRRLSRELATPDSSLADLQFNLMTISEIVLKPVADMLEGKDNIVVVPDGALNLVPFDLLSIDSKKYKAMIDYASISSLPSLRLLAVKESKKAKGGIFAVADPIYPRLEDVLVVEKDALEETTRNINLRGYFAPLPETRTEVQDIAKLFKKKKNSVMFGEQATETNVKTFPLKDYRTLHFATHGILGGEVPGVSEPALILGKAEYDDGFLKASEVEQLELNADLAVLSACNTGSGKLFSGEGVMGMSRSFMLAGSNSVVVSLWPVASKPTQDLMLRFYRHMNSGKLKAESLRAAKLDLRKTLPHPFFWSPFILVGQQ